MTVPQLPPPTGRLRLLAAGVATPGGSGACVGTPLWLDGPAPAAAPAGAVIATVPPGLGYARAAERLRGLIRAGVPVAAVLVAGDEGVLVANRLGIEVPVIDQVDVAGVSACPLVAVEVRAPGQPLTLLTDPVALGAALGLPDSEAGDAATLSRSLLDYSNAVVGYAAAGPGAAAPAGPGPPEPWVLVNGERVALRLATGSDHAGQLSELLGRPVRCLLTEPGAARLGALTTPGARPDAAVVDVGAGTIDVIAPGAEVVAAGAGELLTAAVAETLGISRAAAEWVKRGPCLRVDGGWRFEAEDGGRGFLDRPASGRARARADGERVVPASGA
jgi:hypothetical protein